MNNYSKSLPKGLTIGFVLDDRLDKPDGVQQYVKTLGSWLESKGHEVHYLVGDSPKLKDNPYVHHFAKTIEVRFNKNRMGIPRPADKKAINRLFKDVHFDILHVQVPYSPQLAGRIISSAPPDTAIVGTFHILPFSVIERTGTRLLAATLRSSKKRFSHMFSVSASAQIFAKRYFKVDSTVLPNVVDFQAFQADSKSQKSSRKKIVYLGRLVARKGVLELLDAYEALLESSPERIKTTSLHIGGSGPLANKVTMRANAISQKFNGSLVEIAGFINEGHDKAGFLNQATLAVFPATGGESFGIVLIEAMAAKAEVVLAGNNPGYNSVLGSMPDCMIEPRNTKSFAKHIELLVSDNRLRSLLHNSQQELVQQFSVKEVGPKIVSKYKKLVANVKTKDNNL